MTGPTLMMRKLPAKGSKPCVHCGRTISANKPMCAAGVAEFGTLQAWAASKVNEKA